MKLKNVFLGFLMSIFVVLLSACNDISDIEKDIEKELGVVFVGVDGEGEMQFNEEFEDVIVEIDKQFGLSNGEEVSLKLIVKDEIKEIKYIVSGLREYISKEDISFELIEAIKDHCYAILASKNASDDGYEAIDVRLHKAYYSYKNEHYGTVNQLSLYFATTQKIDNNKEETKYWVTKFINLTKPENGNVVLDELELDALREVDDLDEEIKFLLENQYYTTSEIK